MLITDFAAPTCNKRKVEAGLKWNRRVFLQAELVAAAGAGIGCSANGTPWRFLTVDEARTLAAISDQIIPPDRDPGAAWAGVVNYIDHQLNGPFVDLQPTYGRGIAGINESSRLLYDNAFVDLSAQQQIEVLHCLESGQSRRDLEAVLLIWVFRSRGRPHYAGLLRRSPARRQS
jgi:hypothetical protein